VTRSRRLAVDYNVEKTAQTKKILTTVLADIQKGLRTQPYSVVQIEETEDIPPELSYSLGPLGEGGMSNWFHGLQNPIDDILAPMNTVHAHGTGPYIPPIFSPAVGAVDGAWFGGCTDQQKLHLGNIVPFSATVCLS
jgi:hypothetical protein